MIGMVMALEKPIYEDTANIGEDAYTERETISDAVSVENDSVILTPALMKTGQFYCVELLGSPYLYRKVSDSEIEVYGLAEQD